MGVVPEQELAVGLGTWLTLAGFVVQTIGLIITGVWTIARMDASLRKSIATLSKYLDDEVNRVRREQVEQQIILRKEHTEHMDQVRREFGETVSAVRQKLTDVEIWSRDNFIRNEAFYDFTNKLIDRIEARFDKIDNKIEKLREDSKE